MNLVKTFEKALSDKEYAKKTGKKILKGAAIGTAVIVIGVMSGAGAALAAGVALKAVGASASLTVAAQIFAFTSGALLGGPATRDKLNGHKLNKTHLMAGLAWSGTLGILGGALATGAYALLVGAASLEVFAGISASFMFMSGNPGSKTRELRDQKDKQKFEEFKEKRRKKRSAKKNTAPAAA